MTKVLLVLLLSGGVLFAQECPGSSCGGEKPACSEKSGCDKTGCDEAATMSVAAKLEKMQAAAQKGCATSKTMLASLQKEFKVDSTEALTKQVAACEQYAEKGCDVSKKVLAKINAEFAKMKAQKAKPVLLSARLMQLDKGCAKGCEKSKTLMASLLKEYKAKDTTALVAMVKDWEAKGDEACKSKLATLSAKLPSQKPALSVRIAKLSQNCEQGCKKSGTALASLMQLTKTENAEALLKQVQTWEQKADNGCPKCTAKLADIEAKLTATAVVAKPAGEKPAAKTEKSDCKNCGDCTDCADCGDCPGK